MKKLNKRYVLYIYEVVDSVEKILLYINTMKVILF